MEDTIKISFLGYGYWGKNVLRTLMNEPKATIRWACDVVPERTKQIESDFPSLAVTTDSQQAITDPEVDAVVIATPAETHVPISMQALTQGKHVFVEKPMAANLREALSLAKFVRGQDRVFQVGHIFEYAAPVRVLRDWIQNDQLGKIRYITINRASPGPRLRRDINIVWDYAIHDLYMLMFLLGDEPERVAARGLCNFYANIEDTVFIDLYFPGGTWVVAHSSWVAPTKRRDVTVVGSKAMAVYDETQPNKLVLYKRGYSEYAGFDSWGNYNWHLFDDGFDVPELPSMQPLAAELAHFLDCIANGKRPISDVEDGVRTTRVLEAVNQSLHNHGQEVFLK